MFRRIIQARNLIAFVLSAVVWSVAQCVMRFPCQHPLLGLIAAYKPQLFFGLKWAYCAMQFTTPFIFFSSLGSLGYIFLMKREQRLKLNKLPQYPPPASRKRLFVILGEIHHRKKAIPAEHPKWLKIPQRGLHTGIAIFGAIGGGKTSCCMYPYAEQILAYRSDDPERRASGLVLEVKGNLCHKINKILKQYGRASDYVEIGLRSKDKPNVFRYNPFHNELESYTLAYGIASLLNNLFGKGKDPFWQQAYTNLVKFIILLHKVRYDYVTLFDVYECAINPDLLDKKIKETGAQFREESLLVENTVYGEHQEQLDALGAWTVNAELNHMQAPFSEAAVKFLRDNKIEYQTYSTPGHGIKDEYKREQFEAVKRWFYNDWLRIDKKLQTSVVEGISVFLSLFDDNPNLKWTFCPPKECYDTEGANKHGEYGEPLPPFAELIEQGKIACLNFPVALNPGLAMVIGTLMKQDFQRAVLLRIPQMEEPPDFIIEQKDYEAAIQRDNGEAFKKLGWQPDGAEKLRAKHSPAVENIIQEFNIPHERKAKHWRDVLFLCDEYQNFATCGQNDPSGDEKFFSLSREAKCIPIVATQSISSLRSTLQGESWRTLLQAFRTKIYLAGTCTFTHDEASKSCGQEEQLKATYTFSETGQNARISILSGRSTAHKTSVMASKSYTAQMHPVFEPKIFSELKNAQAIVLAYDGFTPHPASYCYLKPYFLDPNETYFEQLESGKLNPEQFEEEDS